jgi:hypothetical protein
VTDYGGRSHPTLIKSCMCANRASQLHFYNNTLHAWKMGACGQTTYDQLFMGLGVKIITKSRYSGVVSSYDWLREGQIANLRHQYLVRLAHDDIEHAVDLVETFQLSHPHVSFRASFPALVPPRKCNRND